MSAHNPSPHVVIVDDQDTGDTNVYGPYPLVGAQELADQLEALGSDLSITIREALCLPVGLIVEGFERDLAEGEQCNCESSYCDHEHGCQRSAAGGPDMSYVGPICSECAQVARVHGGSHHLHERGTVR